MIAIVVLGSEGRMGRAVEEAAAGASDLRIKARVDRDAETAARVAAGPGTLQASEPGAGVAGYEGASSGGGRAPQLAVAALSQVLAPGDVVVDFSSPEGTVEAARACLEKGAALVSGTTGLDPSAEAAVNEAARRVAVLRAANFSLGILALRKTLALALASLPGDWDIEIVERHHRQKADSPSGTALVLAHEAARQRGFPASVLRYGREGRVGARPSAEIGIHAIRGGTWVGDHQVLIAGPGEWLELRHVAQDRGAFARGALAAARFVATASPGLYTLDHLLHLPS